MRPTVRNGRWVVLWVRAKPDVVQIRPHVESVPEAVT
jgi:hypothetical protein